MKLLFVVLLLFSSQLSFAQGIIESSVDSKYLNSVVPGEYDVRFKKDDDKKDFKKLREFLHERESLLSSLRAEKESHYDQSLLLKQYNRLVSHIKTIMANPSDDLPLSSEDYGQIFGYSTNRYADTILHKVKRTQLKTVLDSINDKIEDSKKEDSISYYLTLNVQNVKNDIDKCQSQIDSALAPEYKQQYFRTNISITFSILIGVLLTIFFFIIYKKSGNDLSKDLLSGYGLQFITLFVLIIAVILFGILGILGSSELSAILSGISGYILGKGIRSESPQTPAAGTPTLPSALVINQTPPVKPVPGLGNPSNILQ